MATSNPTPTLKDGAILIADAHYPHFGDEFVEILKAILAKEFKTPQLILVGDIFDLLFGCGSYIQNFSKDGVELINRVAEEIEVIYLEGNHDFYLSKLFPKVAIYPRELQPLSMRFEGEMVFLSHGDKFGVGWGYEIYSWLIRNRVVLNILKIAERFVIEKNIIRLKNKSICREFEGFEKRVEEILSHYLAGAKVIEGHYHQGRVVKNYISLPSLACQKEVALVRDGEIVFIKSRDILGV
jgi:UDP-2,3-diacylglucosamine hydrolase